MKNKKRTFREAKPLQDLINIFGDNCGCGIQKKGCPCNTCFHSQYGDFNHITWLIVLGLRGDYDVYDDKILELIKDELELGRQEEIKLAKK